MTHKNLLCPFIFLQVSMFLYLFRSQANWDEHCTNVSSALHHVLKAWQCDSKAVPPEQLQVTLDQTEYHKWDGFK